MRLPSDFCDQVEGEELLNVCVWYEKTEENEEGNVHTPQFAYFPHALINGYQFEIRVITRYGILTRQLLYKEQWGNREILYLSFK